MAAELEQLRVSLVAELVGREAFEQLKREVNQVKAATNGLDTTQQKLKSTMGESEKAIRQQRQAFSQTGMQINQFAGQVANGTSPMVAFVQQIGDVTYTLGQAGGALGRFGTFLSGPYAAGILIGISILGPLISKLMEAKEAADTAAQAFRKSVNAFIESSTTVSALTKVLTEGGIASANAAAKMGRLESRVKSLKDALALGGAAMTESQVQVEQGLRSQLASAESQLKVATDEYNSVKGDIARAISTESVKSIQQRNKALLELTADKAKTGSGKGATSAAKKEIASLNDGINDAMKDTMKVLDDYSKAYGATTRDNISLAAAAFNEQQKLNESIKDYNFAENMEKALEPITRVKTMSEAMGQAFSDGIKGMITGAMSFKQVMSNVIDSVINKLFEMFVVQQITGMITKGLTSIGLPGFKAIGGPVQSGKPYVVGERGPEMFVPSRSGSIVPNNALGSGMVVNVDARGASDPAAVRQQVELGIAQAAPYIIAAAQSRTLKTAGRARLPGTIG
jgi:chromosome segregation ATPase